MVKSQHTPETMHKINELLGSTEVDEATKFIIRWQFHFLGNFRVQLALAIANADGFNLELLRRGFPVEVNGYERWALGVEPKIAPKLRAAGLDI